MLMYVPLSFLAVVFVPFLVILYILSVVFRSSKYPKTCMYVCTYVKTVSTGYIYVYQNTHVKKPYCKCMMSEQYKSVICRNQQLNLS